MANHILTYYPAHHITEYNIIIGHELKHGEKGNGLYGIVSRRTGKLLRATLIQDAAELFTQDDSRAMHQCYIE